MIRWLLRVLLAGVLVAVSLAGYAYWSATRMPVFRKVSVAMPDWPAGAKPITVVLIGDVHIGNAVTGPDRFARIADAVTARRPDLVLIAGDFITGHDPVEALAAPGLVPGLKRLRAPLGVVAVPGNHDHWTGLPAVRRALEAAGVSLLANGAVRRGPLALGGLEDMYTRHHDVGRTVAAMRALPGARVLLSHSPDIAPLLPNDVTLVLAGHTHCGQISIPFYGPPVDVSWHGARYRCGVVREGRRTTIVTAGVGTSSLPFRFRVPPDVWLVRLGP